MNDGADPAPYRSLRWEDGVLTLLDQRRLPEETVYLRLDTVEGVADAIRTLMVRGAPAIGAAGAYGVVVAAVPRPGDTGDTVARRVQDAARLLKSTRPTAVNLAWAVDRVVGAVEAAGGDPRHMHSRALSAARAIEQADVRANRAMGQHGLAVIPRAGHITIVHHCNTGALATVDYGTALGVIRAAHEAGRDIEVLVDETRPLLQGARLTMWELMQRRIPATLMVDGAAAHVMRTRGVDLCVVGADRIAANGDVANKIGTYQLAVAARAHGVPFYVAAPTSTIDLATRSGDAMEIEQRAADEVRLIGGRRMAPEGAPVLNPAFDVTPAALVTAIITEVGVVRPPYGDTLAEAVRAAEADNFTASD